MQRKIIQIANSTYLVSLPKKWSEANGIKKGDVVEVTEDNHKLTISSRPGIVEEKEISIDVTGIDRESLMFYLRSLYKAGYDTINITFNETHVVSLKNKEEVRVVDIISREVLRLMGVDMISQKENKCIIKTMTEDTPKAVDNMIRRIFLLLLEGFNDLSVAYKKYDIDILKSIQIKHDTITKLISYAQRIICKIGYNNNKQDLGLYAVLEALDGITDSMKFISRIILAKKGTASEKVSNLLVCVEKGLRISYSFFYEQKISFLSEINDIRYDAWTTVQKTSNKMTHEDLIILSHISHASEKMLAFGMLLLSYHQQK